MRKYTNEDTEVGRITQAVVRVMLDDLSDRRGVLDGIDASVRRGMRNTLHRKVWECLVHEIGLDPDH